MARPVAALACYLKLVRLDRQVVPNGTVVHNMTIARLFFYNRSETKETKDEEKRNKFTKLSGNLRKLTNSRMKRSLPSATINEKEVWVYYSNKKALIMLREHKASDKAVTISSAALIMVITILTAPSSRVKLCGKLTLF